MKLSYGTLRRTVINFTDPRGLLNDKDAITQYIDDLEFNVKECRGILPDEYADSLEQDVRELKELIKD